MELNLCYICGNHENLTIHHIRDIHGKHNKAGKGKVRGLIPLCRKCHDIVENIVNKNKSKKIWYERGYKDGLNSKNLLWY